MNNRFLNEQKFLEAVNESDFEKIQNDFKKSDDDNESEFYIDTNTPFFLDKNLFYSSLEDYFSNVAAADLISTKNIDVLVSDAKYEIDKDLTIEYDQLLKTNRLEMKIFDLTKNASLSGISFLWFEPKFIEEKKIKFSISNQIQIIQMKMVNNEIESAKFLAILTKGIAIAPVFALIKADRKYFQTTYFKNPDNLKFEDIEKDQKYIYQNEFSKKELNEMFANLDDLNQELVDLVNIKHDLGFVPIFPIYFNENFSPIIKNIENEMNELFTISQKLYDESHFMGTKVNMLNVNADNSTANKKELIKSRKGMASASVMINNSLGFDSDLEGRPSVDVLSKSPIWVNLNDAFKQKLNFILKKLGLSSDTDSKGTVQQSIGEVIKQNEFSYNFQNYRNLILQNYLQKLLSCFFIANFNEKEKVVKVVSTQSLGMSEMEKANYVVLLKNNGIIDNIKATSIISGKNYIEAFWISKLQNMGSTGKEEQIKNQEEKIELE